MCHRSPVNSTSSLSNWQLRKGSQHYEELTSWSYSKKIWKFLSLLKMGWEDNLCRKTSCTWTVFLNTARYSLKIKQDNTHYTDNTGRIQYNIWCFVWVSHSRLQLLLHFSVLLLGHSGFTFPQFVHLLSWALKVRLWGCWRNLWMIKQEISYFKVSWFRLNVQYTINIFFKIFLIRGIYTWL